MKSFFILLLGSGFWVSVFAQSDVSDFIERLNTFSADFKQIVKQNGELIQQSQGTVRLKKPLQFRWDYDLPEVMQLISDGKDFYHYDVDLAQVTVRPVSDVANSALVGLLNNKNSLSKLFHVEKQSVSVFERRFPDDAQQWINQSSLFYELTPKEKTDENSTKLLIIGVSSDNTLQTLYAEDAFGENVFLFENVQQNKKISDSVFEFSAPQGVDVLGQ